uniref:Uncharacterized protein n=1 Tax=Trichobilharzia regenti TaxID=157069 RepID=A0AA85JJ08_TRIRE|nr:unnamed protein product [Trichobilharzia regenti]
MKFFLVLATALLFLLNTTECRADQNDLLDELNKLWEGVKTLWTKLEEQCRKKVQAYLDEDGLGEKLEK